jgi:hypothetical protein
MRVSIDTLSRMRDEGPRQAATEGSVDDLAEPAESVRTETPVGATRKD